MKLGRLLACAMILLALPLAAASRVAPAVKRVALPGNSVYQMPVTLTDQQGRGWDWRTRRGRPQVVSMFYSSCKYTCPLIIESGKAVQKQLSPDDRSRLPLLFISLDPKRDTTVALAAIARQRKLDPTLWTLARPAAKDVRAIAGLLGIRYRELADGEFNHTSELILLDAEGRILARTNKIGSVPDPVFVAAVRRATAKVKGGI